MTSENNYFRRIGGKCRKFLKKARLFIYPPKKLKTLQDYETSIDLSNIFPNGFDIYDADVEASDGSALLLTHPILGSRFYKHLDVVCITSHPIDCCCVAFFVDTSAIREAANLTDEEFISIIETEQKAHDVDEIYSSEPIKITEDYRRLFCK